VILVAPDSGREFRVEVESVDGYRAAMWLDEETLLRLAVAICDCYEKRATRELPRSITVSGDEKTIAIRAGDETIRLCRGCASGLASAIVRACETRKPEKGTCFSLN
jgi:hypothetical protein